MAYEFSLRRSRRPAKYPNRIRECRIRRGWNQRELGSRIKVPRSTIAAWERGYVLPAVIAAIHLAEALDTSVQALFPDAATMRRPRAIAS
jgi:DNA-binding XRE family transcriptional regulator